MLVHGRVDNVCLFFSSDPKRQRWYSALIGAVYVLFDTVLYICEYPGTRRTSYTYGYDLFIFLEQLLLFLRGFPLSFLSNNTEKSVPHAQTESAKNSNLFTAQVTTAVRFTLLFKCRPCSAVRCRRCRQTKVRTYQYRLVVLLPAKSEKPKAIRSCQSKFGPFVTKKRGVLRSTRN